MCGLKLTCKVLLAALALIVSAGNTPGIGASIPPTAEFVISSTQLVSTEHALGISSQSLEDVWPAQFDRRH